MPKERFFRVANYFFFADEKRIFDLFAAYYGNSVEEIQDFCNRYEVDYWVVNGKYFCKEHLSKGRLFYEPYNEFIIEKTKGKGRFVLNDIVENRKLFEVANLFVVESDAITLELSEKNKGDTL